MNGIRGIRWSASVVLACVCIMFAAPGFAVSNGLDELVKIAEQKQQDPNQPIKITLDVEGETPAKIGDKIFLKFSTDKDCYLVLLNKGTSDRLTLLFPNKWNKDNHVVANKDYRIPAEGAEYQMELSAPAGTEKIIALATVEPGVFSKMRALQEELESAPGDSSSSGSAASDPLLSLKQIGKVAKDISLVLGQTDMKKWAAMTVEFPVIEKESQPSE